MCKMRGSGVTLVELMIALAIAAVVGTGVVQAVLVSSRVRIQQAEWARAGATIRAAASILGNELRQLDPESDILAASDSSIRYRVLNNLYVVCKSPAPQSPKITVHADFLGIGSLNPANDSVFVYAEGDTATADDDRWVHADLLSVHKGDECPNRMPSLTVEVGGVTQPNLMSISSGAPVRIGGVVELLRYRDRRGAWWVGMRGRPKSGVAHRVQPLLGPLAARGLKFAYLDVNGSTAAAFEDIAAIRIAITARAPLRSGTPVALAPGAPQHIEFTVALRNAAP